MLDFSENVTNTITTSEQIKYIKYNINNININDKTAIANIIKNHNMTDLLKECAEGIIINITVLPANVIKEIYDLMV